MAKLHIANDISLEICGQVEFLHVRLSESSERQVNFVFRKTRVALMRAIIHWLHTSDKKDLDKRLFGHIETNYYYIP